ncbi:MAG TPA: hypothetical protein VMB02_02920 [Candidatus Aquilonibacter sp.]|nr:hypothetical protein [Candidatus Aquilonibacter sp.]
MKKTFLLIFACAWIALAGAPAYAHNNNDHNDRGKWSWGWGCDDQRGKDRGCSPVSVPEPSSFELLGAGLLVLGGAAALLGYKKPARN